MSTLPQYDESNNLITGSEQLLTLWKKNNNFINSQPYQFSNQEKIFYNKNLFSNSILNKNIPRSINNPTYNISDFSILVTNLDGTTTTIPFPISQQYITIQTLETAFSSNSILPGAKCLIPGYNYLEFYYKYECYPTSTKTDKPKDYYNTWFIPDIINSTNFEMLKNNTSQINLLQNTIPKLYDSLSSRLTYNYKIYISDSQGTTYNQDEFSSFPFFAYLLEETGILQFFGGDRDQNSVELNYSAGNKIIKNQDGFRPRLSYIRYVGPTGFDDLEMSGNIVVDGNLNINGDLNINGQNVVNFVKNKYSIGSSTLKTDSVLYIETSNPIDVSGMTNDISKNIDWNDSSNCFIITQDDYYQINFSVGISSEENFVGMVKANVLVNDISQITVQLGEKYVPIEFANIETLTGSKVLSLNTSDQVKLTIQCESSFNVLANLTYLTINSLDNANIAPIFVNETTEKINTNQETSNSSSLISDSSFSQWIFYGSLDISLNPTYSSNYIIYYANLKYLISNIIQNTTNFQETTISIKVDKYIGSPPDSSENLFEDLSLGIIGITTINNVNTYEIYHLDTADTTELITYKLSFKINGTDIDAYDDLSFGILDNSFNYVSYQEINFKKSIYKLFLSNFDLISNNTNFFKSPINGFTLKIVPEDNDSYIFIYINLTYSLFILNNKTISFKLIKYKGIESPKTIFSKRIGTINVNYIKDKFSILHIDKNTDNINNDTLYYTLYYEVDDGGTYTDIQISSENSYMFGYEIFETNDLINDTLNHADITDVYATTSLQYKDICSTQITIESDTSYVILNYDLIYNATFEYNSIINFRLQKTVISDTPPNTITLIEDISLGNRSTSLGFYNNYNINYIDNTFSLRDDISYSLEFYVSSNLVSNISLGIISCNQNIYQLKDSNQRVLDSIKYNKAFDITGSDNIKVTTDDNNYKVELKDDINVNTIKLKNEFTSEPSGNDRYYSNLDFVNQTYNPGAGDTPNSEYTSSNQFPNRIQLYQNIGDGIGRYDYGIGIGSHTLEFYSSEKFDFFTGSHDNNIRNWNARIDNNGYLKLRGGITADETIKIRNPTDDRNKGHLEFVNETFNSGAINGPSATNTYSSDDQFPNRIQFYQNTANGNFRYLYGIGIGPNTLEFYSSINFDFFTNNNGNNTRSLIARIDGNGDFTVAGSVYANGSATALSSDDRIKHNEVNIENGLFVIRQLQPQKYQKTREMYPADYVGEISGDWIWEAGLIAQEILKIDDISFSVTGGDEIGPTGETIEKIYYLNYNNLFTYGLAAIKELDQIVSTQATTIANLEQTVQSQSVLISDLTSRIVALESKI